MGDFKLQGSISYMDPILYKVHKNHTINENIRCDVFKNDIFSLGLTLIELATG